MTNKASCLCGSVTWEITTEPFQAFNCHCKLCRKAHGSAFGTYWFMHPDQFRWTSATDTIAHYRSSHLLTRSFCGTCGSVVPYPSDARDHIVSLGGCHDRGKKSDCNIFVAHNAPWHDITESWKFSSSGTLPHVPVHGPVGSGFRHGHGSTAAFGGSMRPAVGVVGARPRLLEAPEACAVPIRTVSARPRPGPARHERRRRLDSWVRGVIDGMIRCSVLSTRSEALVALNIRNRRAEELAATLARLTGETKHRRSPGRCTTAWNVFAAGTPAGVLPVSLTTSRGIARLCRSSTTGWPRTFSVTTNAACRPDGHRHIGVDCDPS